MIDYHKAGSSSAAPPEYPYDRSRRYIIFEIQWGTLADATAYRSGHVPGAIHSNTDTYENLRTRWFLLSDDKLKTAAGSMGVTPDTPVVVYSDSSIFAARLWWILKYLGVKDARIMNGGYAAWIARGYAGETAVNKPEPAAYNGKINPEMRATSDYTLSVYKSSKAQIVDVRSEGEYLGASSGYANMDAKGRIPGAIWARDADPASRFYNNADGSLRNVEDIKSMWRTLGITSTASPARFDKEVIFYCGGGYRSSLAYFYAYLMGYANIRNYSDGWEGWSVSYTRNPSGNWIQGPSGRPIASGK
jgi:thiosulfate/3-mercaptopyruvate sulfurtransferase